MRNVFLARMVVLLSIVMPVLLLGQEYDTVITPRFVKNFEVPVTYYDYHVDGSNPDFGTRVTYRWDHAPVHEYKNYSGWVDSLLTSDKSPKRNAALTDTFYSISWNVEKLFKPSVAGVKDTFVWKTVPDTVYVDSLDSTGSVVSDSLWNPIRLDTILTLYPDTIMISDTMFKNIVIQDSIKFSWVPDNDTYEDSTDSIWLAGQKSPKMDPLQGKGFGDDGSDGYNAGYTMRLHNRFTYRGGEKLYFGADDDCYAFINGKLAIEGGGFHSPMPDTAFFDSLNLTVGQTYDIDIFYIERRMGGGVYIGGFTGFETKGLMGIDTLYDTTYVLKPEGVLFPSVKGSSKQRTLLGLSIPSSASWAQVEYFTVAGTRLFKRAVPLVSGAPSALVHLPQGMYLVRVRFLDSRGSTLSVGSCRKMVISGVDN